MSWAELQIPQPPKTGNVDFDTWMQKLVTHLRNYLGSFHNRGDPAAVDYDQTGLTTDNTWRDLDLSAIVPAEAKAILLSVVLNDDAAGSVLQFRKNGNSNSVAVATTRTQVAGVGMDGSVLVPCDANRIIEYKGSNLAFTTIQITVIGWFK